MESQVTVMTQMLLLGCVLMTNVMIGADKVVYMMMEPLLYGMKDGGIVLNGVDKYVVLLK